LLENSNTFNSLMVSLAWSC